jgi:glycosyltransferase involved in cell wall biosynthesis
VKGKIPKDRKDMKAPYVSIVIPTANRPQYLPRAVNSALAEMDAKDIEVIVVPNGPDDSWRETLRPYDNNHSVRVFSIEEANANIARNTGLGEAQGEFIRFLDDDDYLIPENAAKQYDLIQSSGADVVSGNVQLVDESGRGLDVWRQPNMEDLCAAVLGPWRNCLPTAHVYRRSSLGAARWNPATIVRQDIDWMLDLCASKELLWYKSDEIVGVWQQHKEQRTSSKTRFNNIQKLTVSMLMRTYKSLQMDGRLNDMRRKAVVLELWVLIHSAFFLEPFYWHQVASTALEIDSRIRPLQPLYNFTFIRKLNPLLIQWLMLPKRWTFYRFRHLLKKMRLRLIW